MSRPKSRQNGKECLDGWDAAISKAESMLPTAGEAKAKRLKTHIAWMKESRAAGEPWGDEIAGMCSVAIPA